MTVFWIIFIPHQIVTRLCLLLDYLFFPDWKKTAVVNPVFITGLFRSGTTFLHRLLAKDSANFSAFKTWEIYLAPSILQRKALKAWKKMDRLMGSPAMRWLEKYNKRNLGEVQFHQVGLWKEEEDEGLLLFLWDSFFTWFFFPDTAGIEDYMYADREMSSGRQKRKMTFYRNCLKRHMYCHPEAKFYLSKNPAFTPKLGSLKEAFPDARIIYLVRDPARVLVSQAAWFSFVWHYFASPEEKYPFLETLEDMTEHWYRYPLEVLENQEEGEYSVLEYSKLISAPVETIMKLYDHFSWQMDNAYRAELSVESEKTGEYASGKKLRIDEVGYDEEEIRERFASIYKRFS